MQHNIASDLSGWITDKRKEKRWKAKLHWRSFFTTSNRQCFSQQSAGLQGDGVVISWQRGAGHVGTTRLTSKTPDLKNADCTLTLSVCVCDSSLFVSVSLSTHSSYLPSPLFFSLAHIHGMGRFDLVLDFGNLQACFERNRKFWKWKRFEISFESEMSSSIEYVLKGKTFSVLVSSFMSFTYTSLIFSYIFPSN